MPPTSVGNLGSSAPSVAPKLPVEWVGGFLVPPTLTVVLQPGRGADEGAGNSALHFSQLLALVHPAVGRPPSSQMLSPASQQQLWLLPQQRPFNLLFPARSSGQGIGQPAGHPHTTSLQKRRELQGKATHKEPFVICGA